MTENRTYRACVVGLSGIGAGRPPVEGDHGLGHEMPHCHVPAYAHLPFTEVAGVCDLKEDLLQDTLRDWSGTFPDLRGFTDYREMLETCKPDLLSVVTSDNRHADIVVDAVEAGVRGIYCEKPIATTLADADRMIAAVEGGYVAMTINHTRRWLPVYREVRKRIDNGEIGELKRITLNFTGPRAILFRNGTHMIDMICFLAGAEPEWVFAELDDGYEDYWPYQGDGGRNADLEPGCSGFIHFRNGVRALYNGSKNMESRQGYQLDGTDGWMFIHRYHYELNTGDGIQTIVPDSPTEFNSAAAVRDLVHVMENGGKTISPPRAARNTLEIILGFLASQKNGNVRIDFPLDENTV